MNPKVSVIIAIDDERKFLEKCLNSLVNQTLEDIEIICINSSGGKACKKICSKFQKEDERVKFIDIEKGHFATAKCFALKMVKGEFFTFINPNDWLREMYLEQMYNICSEKKVDVGISKTLKEINDYIEPEESYNFKKVRFGDITLKEGFKNIYYNFSLKGKFFNSNVLKEIKVTDNEIDKDILAGYLLLKKARKSIYTNYAGYIENETIDRNFEKVKLMSEKFMQILNTLNNWEIIIEDVKENYDESMLKECVNSYSKFIVDSVVEVSKETDADMKEFYLQEINEKIIKYKKIIKEYNKVSKNEKNILSVFLLDYRLIMLQKFLMKKV